MMQSLRLLLVSHVQFIAIGKITVLLLLFLLNAWLVEMMPVRYKELNALIKCTMKIYIGEQKRD